MLCYWHKPAVQVVFAWPARLVHVTHALKHRHIVTFIVFFLYIPANSQMAKTAVHKKPNKRLIHIFLSLFLYKLH